MHQKHLKGLKALSEENICRQYFLISHDKIHRKQNHFFHIVHWKKFLEMFWSDQIL